MNPALIGRYIDYQAKQITYNVYSYYKSRKMDVRTIEHQEDINLIVTVANVTGISKSSVTRIIREGNLLKAETGVVHFKQQEKKKHVRKKRIEINNITEGVIRRKVIQFYTVKKEVPSVRKLNSLLKEENVLNCSTEYLRQLLHRLGFTNSESESGMLLENPEIVKQRLLYLQTIKDFRGQDRSIFFLNETKRWQIEKEFVEIPSIVIVHVSGSSGFEDGALLMCKPKCEVEEEDDTQFEHFENYDWIKDIFLPNIPPSSVIVMNVPYCETLTSAQLDEKPTASSTRATMQDWLKRHNVVYRETEHKADLLQLINNQQTQKEYSIEKVLSDNGHVVLNIPENHCDLNPIFMMWEELKELCDEKTSPMDLFTKFSEKKWHNFFEKVEQNENEYYDNGMKMDEAVDSLLLTMKKEKPDDSTLVEDDNVDSDEDMECVF